MKALMTGFTKCGCVKGATEMQGRRSILKPGLDLAALASSFRTDDVVKDLPLSPNRAPNNRTKDNQ